jgi:phosphonate transport system substrate-binding protein
MNTLRFLIASSLTACLGLVTLFAAAPVFSDQKHEYTFGVFPHLPPRQLEKVYAPIAKEFSEILGREVHLRSNSSYQNFMENLDQGKFDIAFVQPFDYVRVADNMGYKPLATRIEPLTTIFVVGKDSKIKSAKDLKGKTIALPPKVAAVSRLTMDYLKKLNLDPDKDVTITHHRSHVSCMQQVIIKVADTCGTAAPALRFFEHKMKVDLDVVAETGSIPHALFTAHPQMSEEDYRKIKAAILSWSKTKKGQALLKHGKLSPYKDIKDEDYNVVRKMQ